ncbi:DUF4097 family beta strand repeat protein [Glaciecola sp. MH2013]|uniref:DUF4097 family beta strand repeat-containing protein n=1 Tax=Glaciecola sp. MH2013 TaxID=2785524 RepID=UPI00189FB7B4|nr:DUF4097 family beta strand repeat-containing protein [Glaciecola sp. MH2013]MBF7074139.1 DUF4097 family beta strand repeat protein [Glaciecola sp. MH2013]
MKNVIVNTIKVAFVGIVLSVSSTALLAKQSVDEQMSADPKGSVEIEHVNGTAVITGWDKEQVSVKGELGDNTEDFRFERNGSSIQIIVETKKKNSWGNWGKDDGDTLTIFVPRGSRVSYTSVNAEIAMSNILGGTDIEVVNGDIDVKDLFQKIRLESVNGDIKANNLDGDLAIETVNGDINATQLSKQPKSDELALSTVNGDISIESNSSEVSAETVNGSIELVLQEVDEVELNTVNGSVDVEMILAKDASVDVTSVGGSIDLSFQKGVGARFDIEAHAGGSIKNTISDDKQQKAKYGPRRWLEFSTQNPTASVDVSTVNGRVKLTTK